MINREIGINLIKIDIDGQTDRKINKIAPKYGLKQKAYCYYG